MQEPGSFTPIMAKPRFNIGLTQYRHILETQLFPS